MNVDVAFKELVRLVRKDEQVSINYDISFESFMESWAL